MNEMGHGQGISRNIMHIELVDTVNSVSNSETESDTGTCLSPEMS